MLINNLIVFGEADAVCQPAHFERRGISHCTVETKLLKCPLESCSIVERKLSKQSCRVGFMS